jgi:hypothetical protein
MTSAWEHGAHVPYILGKQPRFRELLLRLFGQNEITVLCVKCIFYLRVLVVSSSFNTSFFFTSLFSLHLTQGFTNYSILMSYTCSLARRKSCFHICRTQSAILLSCCKGFKIHNNEHVPWSQYQNLVLKSFFPPSKSMIRSYLMDFFFTAFSFPDFPRQFPLILHIHSIPIFFLCYNEAASSHWMKNTFWQKIL